MTYYYYYYLRVVHTVGMRLRFFSQEKWFDGIQCKCSHIVIVTFEFSLNVVIEFAEFSDKNICHYSKRAPTCHPAISCLRDQDATTAPARHR